jgi:hypothetical protein
MAGKKGDILVRLSAEQYALVSELQRVVKRIGMDEASNRTNVEMEPGKVFTKGRAIAFAFQHTIRELTRMR